MVKKHDRLKRISLVILCILSIIPLFAVGSSASDYATSGWDEDSYMISQVALNHISIWDSNDPEKHFGFDWPGFYRGGMLTDSTLNLLVANTGNTAASLFIQNITRTEGYPGPSSLINYILRPFSGVLTSYNRLRVSGGQFYAHPYNSSLNAPYAGNWTPYMIGTFANSGLSVEGTYTINCKVRTWNEYIYSSDFVNGTWKGVSYTVRDVTFTGNIENGIVVLAPTWDQFVAENVTNMIYYVHNGNIRTSSKVLTGNNAYVDVLSYDTTFNFSTSIPAAGGASFYVSDMVVLADNLDAFNGVSATNNGLSFADVHFEVGTFLKDSLASFLEFELFPSFSISDLLWLILGVLIVTALIFLMRR